MPLHRTFEARLVRLTGQLRLAPTVTNEVFSKVIAETCLCLPVLVGAERGPQIARLIEVGAWTDAALALIEVELPQWTFCRLVYEGGEWDCSLSRNSDPQIWFDKAARGRHGVPSLAVLLAFVEACRITVVGCETDLSIHPPKVWPKPICACCDDFG
jgi:hypothetical protein